jgi:serine protease AprX
MSQLRRTLLILSSAMAVGMAPILVPAATAATTAPSPGPGAPQQPTAGKGDTDGDRLADDLEAALTTKRARDRVSVIVQGTSPDKAQLAAPSFTLRQRYRIIPAFSGSVTAGQVGALARIPGVTRVELDGISKALDAAGNRDYGVEAARAAGLASDGTLDGDGVGICVIDTGIDPNHEQLTGRIVAWKDWINPATTTPYDDHGHGTHVSGIAAGDGTGAVEATAAAYGGVARGASLIGAKVLSSSGSGSDANVVAAIDWCAQRADVRVISMSLGGPGGDGKDAASQASDAAVLNQGKVVVVAAGNDGDGEQTIASPGVSTQAITVGAASDQSAPVGDPGHDNGLYLAAFSSRGPTANPSAPLKPDVVAPGLTVVSAKRATTSGYITYSGTSMATPFVSGVVALGLEAVPSATPAQVKAALQSSAHDAGTAGADNDWGYGLVDARAFIDTLKAISPATKGPFPDHSVVSASVPDGATKDIPITLSRSGEPLGISIRIEGTESCSAWIFGICWAYEWSPDLDATLRDPSGTEVALTECPLDATNGNCGPVGRWETLGVASAAAGTWTLRVVPFSGSPNNGKGGSFTVDVFGALGATEPPPPPPPGTAPPAPDGLTASATSRTAIDLAWVDHADNESGFSVERCKGATCTNFVEVTRTNGTTWLNTGLKSSTTYRYRVRAYNSVGFSAYSDIASATTPRR